MNLPACARLEYTHPGCARVRRAFGRHCCKKLGSSRRRKATTGAPPARLIPASSGGKEVPPQGRQPRTAKARPPITGGRVGLLRPHLIGNTHEDRIRSPDREELQTIGQAGLVGQAGSHGYSPSGLTVGGRFIWPSAYSSSKHICNAHVRRRALRPVHHQPIGQRLPSSSLLRSLQYMLLA